ncbi:helix-turn-helix transcriptional regulator [Micromonospora peucetia]|uniref:Helix-turn-helix transcriptional regulator n=1 Tax=Micromonospora peucetia TaxID=47871 RepID=A0ABZ1E8H0_9ACTN|nr:helix-turn-helix transcriptional regulator [Micromonospora peucetia]WSA30794.1 helix-turn-helix transcriptional regulator [Micromonospora peucetia]
MTPPPPPGPQLLGPLLAQLRLARGWSQLRVAAELCAASGVPTLSRNEVSRWERQLRVPGEFWLGWLAVVLAVPVDLLSTAATRTRGLDAPPTFGGSRPRAALLALAQRWVADPRAVLLPGTPAAGHRPPAGPPGPASTSPQEADGGREGPVRLAELRRLDDLAGGADLAGLGAYRLGRAVRALSGCGPSERRRLLPGLAESAQLAGWLAADAGDAAGALDTYRLALRAAATAGDPALAGHVLGSASHLLTGVGDPQGALVLARIAYAGARQSASPGLRALLLHRVALAAALGGRAGAARQALDAACRLTDAPEPGREPPWLYWLDGPELAAMAGRTLVAMGRPLPAEAPLHAVRRRSPRTAAIYGGWLARGYLRLGEVERACAVAGEALLDAVRAGSPRAVGQLAEVRRLLAGHGDVPAVRRYRALATAATPYLPRSGPPPGPTGRRAPAGRTARRPPGGATGSDPTG